MADTVPPGFSPNSEEEPPGSNLWVDESAGPDPPGGHVEHPDAGIDPAKATPGSPDYNSHFDPHVSNPEIPVPGLHTWPDDFIVEPGGNADGHIDYPDVEAPVSPKQQAKNLLGAMFQTNIWVNGVLKFQPSCPPMGTPQEAIEAHRDQVRALLFFIFWDRRAKPGVVMQTRDLAADRWIDLTSDTVPPIVDWNGLVTVDVRVNAGWGSLL